MYSCITYIAIHFYFSIILFVVYNNICYNKVDFIQEDLNMKWYAIVFNYMGLEIAKSPDFSSSAQATFWAEAIMKGNPNSRFQLFQK